ncbi:hypothetical protein ELI36_32585 [Rhizobium ruizarguesonis]|uniref:hypothetical protein n=1 Tax=Rhizobium TaxID=379 RepID=UPI001030DCAC|nr:MULTISPECIES: hypothetical protein [Rhizobium]MBY5416121.1 hypothetical protein [Rhizobium leguminosarum]TAV21282.1 hypothetical protein ELI36_32585 [Rhizobium ruizarguesonis]
MMSISSSRDFAQNSPVQIFYPLSTVRCVGPVLFRDQLARDIACLLDVDDDVLSWSCRSLSLSNDGQVYKPDFMVERADVRFAVDGVRDDGTPDWAKAKSIDAGFPYEAIAASALPRIRLKNAQDLLRYARYEAPLSDRIRLLAALDECSRLTVAEALIVFREIKPVAGLASMVLHRFIEMDLDERLIGPETIVRRRRD